MFGSVIKNNWKIDMDIANKARQTKEHILC